MIAYFNQEGASWVHSDAWDEYLAPIPVVERGDMMSAYYRRLTGPDEARLTFFLNTKHSWCNCCCDCLSDFFLVWYRRKSSNARWPGQNGRWPPAASLLILSLWPRPMTPSLQLHLHGLNRCETKTKSLRCLVVMFLNYVPFSSSFSLG